MLAIVIILVLLLTVVLYRRSRLPNLPGVPNIRNKQRKLILEYTDNIAVNQYCPYRAMLGTWKSDNDKKLIVKLQDPNTLLIGQKIVKNPTCRIGKFIEIKDTDRNEVYKISDGKCVMPSGELFVLL